MQQAIEYFFAVYDRVIDSLRELLSAKKLVAQQLETFREEIVNHTK